MRTAAVNHKPGRNINHVLNGWKIGWVWVVADSPVKKSAARAARKVVGAYMDPLGGEAWPYIVDGVKCDVLNDHAVSLAAAAEKGKKMADVLRSYGITSRVYVMTDKQYGLAYVKPNEVFVPGWSYRNADRCAKLSGIEITQISGHPGNQHTHKLTAKQSIPVHQTSL